MSRFLFLVTSALNTRFGVFDADQRLQQTLETVRSIRSRAAGARVALLEMAGQGPTVVQEQALKAAVDMYLDFTRNRSVVELYQGTDNWDIVKNATEMHCFGTALRGLAQRGVLDRTGRVFKLSGRYTLNEHFDLAFYERAGVADKVVLKRRIKSQFPLELTQIPLQYTSRLWSFPTGMAKDIADRFDRMRAYMTQRVNAGGYADIEHCLFKFLEPESVLEIDRIGVQGSLGATGFVISD